MYYHLKDPLRALDSIWDVLNTDGKALVAGEVLLSYAESLNGEVMDQSLIKKMAESNVPITVCYPGHNSKLGSTCWFVPNVACLKSWFTATGFELEYHHIHDNPKAKPRSEQRFVGMIRKINNKIIEHPIRKKV